MISHPFNQFKSEVKNEKNYRKYKYKLNVNNSSCDRQTSPEAQNNIHNGNTSMWRTPVKLFIAGTLSVHNNFLF